jgi:TolB-like protein/DNA-binding winged helix-turn-helix (wHTH) protein/cytochrome c-type biogenesis protein CcmH/NrfG
MRFAFGEYALEPETRTLHQRGERVPIEPKVFDILVYLIENRERVVSVDELLDNLWSGVTVTPVALSRAVQKARQAVGDDGEHQTVLRTEHGHGFRFVAEVSISPAQEAVTANPTVSRARFAAGAGVTAVLLLVAVAWFLYQPAAESAPPRSVAVLPFANMSQDAAAQPFTNGIYDDILTHLSKIRDLKVIARTTMERLDPSLGIQEIGTKLGVAAVLEGGVQRAGDRIRINVQLNDCETEAHLWSETYDYELTAANIFAIQSEIATSVAGALRATLSPEEQDRIATAPTENLAAYQVYLLGRQRLSKLTTAAVAEAVDYFQQAIELDPSYALAYVGLADSYVHQASWGGAPVEETLTKARAAAEKALALDDRLGEVYVSLARIKTVEGDLEGAEATYQRALELSPNYAIAYQWYGELLNRRMGRSEDALSISLKAAELDPLSAYIVISVGAALEFLGRLEEALVWYERSLELDPTSVDGFIAIGTYDWLVRGRFDQAVVWYRRAISLDPGYSAALAELGEIFLDLGDLDTATFWSNRAIALGSNYDVTQNVVQLLHLYRNDEAAIEFTRKAFSDGPFSSPLLILLREHYLDAGRYSDARALFEHARPELFDEDDPQVNSRNFLAAINLAGVLFKTGEQEHANLLLAKILREIQTKPRLGGNGYGVTDVEIFTLRGEKQKALSALRQAIDEGWRPGWWHWERDPNLESLHGEPEFQTMVEEVRADMAEQLARVREMERNGELEPIPEVSATTH